MVERVEHGFSMPDRVSRICLGRGCLAIPADMPDTARERAAAGDRAAQLDEQIAEGHEWATKAEPNSSGDLHSDAATEHRRAAGQSRSKAECARNED
ncbi:MAG: hypothetical protein MK097_18550, partial [Dechloromonas sp.]|nr:hypothetical protein [Dechloromonas sp.]